MPEQTTAIKQNVQARKATQAKALKRRRKYFFSPESWHLIRIHHKRHDAYRMEFQIQ